MKILNMKIIVGIGLFLFAFVFGNIVLNGLLNTNETISVTMFKTIYFVFLLLIFGIIYILNRNLLNSKTEHAIIILSILVFAMGMASAAGNFKSAQDNGFFTKGSTNIDSLQAQNNQYLQYVKSMTNLENSIQADNKLLESQIGNLTEQINNKKPVVVETIVTIPGEIIYEEEPQAVVVRPVVNERENEEDD
jgi:hypothetical protein